jgi:flagellin
LTDLNGNNDITAVETGDPNTNQVVGSVTGLTTAATNTSQVTSSLGSLTTGTVLASGDVVTVSRGTGVNTIYTASAATTVGNLITAITTGSGTGFTVTTSGGGITSGLGAALVGGHLIITDTNNGGNLTVTPGPAAELGTFANTPAGVLATGEVITVTRGTGASTYTVLSGGTVANLINSINTGTGNSGITAAVTGTGVLSGLGAALVGGHLAITDSTNGGNIAVTDSGSGVGTFADTADKTFAAPFINPTGSTSTVQSLINAINSDSVVGAKAALVNGQLQVTDPFDRGDLAVTTTDTVLGAVVSGAQTAFPNTTIGSSAPNANELVSNAGTSGTPLTATTTLAAGTVTSFTSGGKTFTYTAPTGGSTIGALISAIDNPLTDPANLQAYIGTVGSAAGQLVVVDPLGNNDLAVGPTNANTALGTFSNPVTTASPTTNIFLSDSTAVGSSEIAVTIGSLNTASITNGSGTSGVNLAGTDLNTQGDAQAALIQIGDAIANIASVRGTLGAVVNRLTAAGNVLNSQVLNLTAAESTITSADIPTVVANLTSESILEQTGISALAQANQQQQLVLKLLQ